MLFKLPHTIWFLSKQSNVQENGSGTDESRVILVKVVMEALHPLIYTTIQAYDVKLYRYVTGQGVNNDSIAQYAVIIED